MVASWPAPWPVACRSPLAWPAGGACSAGAFLPPARGGPSRPPASFLGWTGTCGLVLFALLLALARLTAGLLLAGWLGGLGLTALGRALAIVLRRALLGAAVFGLRRVGDLPVLALVLAGALRGL